MREQPTPKDAAKLLYYLRSSQGRHQTAPGAGLTPHMALLRTWQSERLARTHADLLASPRYGPACRFFLSDLYAPRDFSQRDHDIERIYDFMRRFLPPRLLRPLALAVELNALTLQLDDALLNALVNRLGMSGAINSPMVAEAYRLCDNYQERARQIDLIVAIGQDLGRLVRLPLISISLKLARAPAHRGGWFELQDFLERGLAAFKEMRGTKQFLRLVETREKKILDQIFAGNPDPFAL
ncbi:MAG: hypothetical protein ACE5G8_09965 [Anaerolineae bacterium]